MRLNRFFGNFEFLGKTIRIADAEILNQLKNVLRLKSGAEIILCDGKMNEALCMIADFGKDFIDLNILEINKNKSEPEKEIILYCSILKKENFELVVQKAVEIGVKKIVPIISAHTVKLGIKPDRLEKIIREASEQSGRGILPVLSEVLDFEKAVSGAKTNDFNLFFDASGKDFSEMKLLPENNKIGIFIGPEGGWSEEEIELAKKSGFQIASLGKLVLRAETAAIVASYLIYNR